jgi:hypothetical protein
MSSDARQTLSDFLKRELDDWREAGKAKSEREWDAKGQPTVDLHPMPETKPGHRPVAGSLR